MLSGFRRAGLLIRALAATVLIVSGVLTGGPARAVGISPKTALVRVLTARPIQPSWFAPTFLAQVSVAQVQEVVDGLVGQLGSYKSVTSEPDGSFLVHYRDGTANAQIH